MSKKFFKDEFIPPEEKNLHQLTGKNFQEALEYLEEEEGGYQKWKQDENNQ